MRIPADVKVAFGVIVFALGMGAQAHLTPVRTVHVTDHVASACVQSLPVVMSCPVPQKTGPIVYSTSSTSSGTAITMPTQSGAWVTAMPYGQ